MKQEIIQAKQMPLLKERVGTSIKTKGKSIFMLNSPFLRYLVLTNYQYEWCTTQSNTNNA